ncbi:hypothetical protein CNR22_22585 [Sphingobacteriaceae bacterium]|nr:hypothetical protein CNR22_22585 [Sphingobacteriaceae bacterium]
MNEQEYFMVIDDDELNSQLFEIIIRHVSREAKAIGFNSAEDALEFLAKEYKEGYKSTVLFVDVNMPFCSGWEFLELYDKLDEHIKKQVRVYMLSSSIDQNDRRRALADKNVADYLEKPLTTDLINSIRLTK